MGQGLFAEKLEFFNKNMLFWIKVKKYLKNFQKQGNFFGNPATNSM